VGDGRVIFALAALGNGTQVTVSWQALSFDVGARFDVFRSTDGGITFEPTPCGSTIYSTPGAYSIVDGGVTRNYRHAYPVYSTPYNWL
jgi:hypothetical protein